MACLSMLAFLKVETYVSQTGEVLEGQAADSSHI